jgi:hypothetical protein
MSTNFRLTRHLLASYVLRRVQRFQPKQRLTQVLQRRYRTKKKDCGLNSVSVGVDHAQIIVPTDSRSQIPTWRIHEPLFSTTGINRLQRRGISPLHKVRRYVALPEPHRTTGSSFFISSAIYSLRSDANSVAGLTILPRCSRESHTRY